MVVVVAVMGYAARAVPYTYICEEHTSDCK